MVATGYGAVALDGSAADIEPVGAAAAAGSTGLAADAGHVHAGFSLLAGTSLAGYPLVNGTGTILSWTAPDDGQLHRVSVAGSLNVNSAETGGLVQLVAVDPAGGTSYSEVAPAGAAAGSHVVATPIVIVGPGTVVAVKQESALTAGAATLWAELWGL